MTIVLQRKLLAHPEFLSMLVSGLLLAEDHPRLPVAETTHHWCQTMHAECLMQLAVFPEVRSDSSAKARSDVTLTCVGHACERAANCALQGKAPRSSSSFYYANFTATMEAYISNATDINNSVRKQCFWPPSLCLNCKQMTILPRQARDQIQGRFNKRTHTVYAGHRLRGRGWRRLHHL